MDFTHVAFESGSNILLGIHLESSHLFGGYRDECILWPREEPINTAL